MGGIWIQHEAWLLTYLLIVKCWTWPLALPHAWHPLTWGLFRTSAQLFTVQHHSSWLPNHSQTWFCSLQVGQLHLQYCQGCKLSTYLSTIHCRWIAIKRLPVGVRGCWTCQAFWWWNLFLQSFNVPGRRHAAAAAFCSDKLAGEVDNI